MNKLKGFTLTELVIFIVVVGIIGAMILAASTIVLRHLPAIQNQIVAEQLADRCMSWYLGQRYTKGYSSITCPSSAISCPISGNCLCSIPSYLSANFTINANVSYVSIPGDPGLNHKLITVTVGGAGKSTLSLLVSNYD